MLRLTFFQPVSIRKILVCLAGVAAVTLSGGALIGWALENETLKRLAPQFVAMNPATATCSVFLGVALILQSSFRGTAWPRRILAAVVTGVCAIKLADVAFGTNSGVDRFIFAARLASETTANEFPMAPNAAVNLILLSIAVVSLTYRNQRTIFIGQVCAFAAAVISALAIFGYYSGQRSLYDFVDYFPMAGNTTLVTFALASGLLFARPLFGSLPVDTLTVEENDGPPSRQPIWFAAVAGTLISLGLWWAFHSQQQASRDALLSFQAEAFANLLISEAKSLNGAQMRMARRWGDLSRPLETSSWPADARSYLTDFPHLDNIRLVDARGYDRASMSREGGYLENNAPQSDSESVAFDTLDPSRDNPTYSVVRVSWNDAHTASYGITAAPLYTSDNRFDGYLLMRVNFGRLLRRLYDQSGATAHIVVTHNGIEYYPDGQSVLNLDDLPRAESEIQFGGEILKVAGFSTAALERGNLSVLPVSVLITSLVLTFLTSALLYQRRRLEGISTRLRKVSRAAGINDSNYFSFIQELSDAITVVDTDGKIIMVNRKALDLFEYKEQELTGRDIECLIPPSVGQHHVNLRKAYMAAPTSRTMAGGANLSALKSTGEEFSAEISLSSISLSRGTGIAAAIRDVSSRKRAEEALRDAEIAKRASEVKSIFMATMSHEIRTPLNGIVGNLELMAHTDLNDELSVLVDDADKAAKSLLALIGNILDYSKIEAGKLSIEIGTMDPIAVVQESIHVLQGRARQKGLFIVSIIGPDVPRLVRGDAQRVRQILLNLIGNALKFTVRGGIRVRMTAEATDDASSVLRIEIHDSGVGFPPALAERLFEPFAQNDNASGEGTGLGLSICRSLITLFGGELTCEGAPGEGATFLFTVPVKVIEHASSESVPIPNLNGKHQLFIGERNASALRLEKYFIDRGGEVEWVPDEYQASALAERRRRDRKDPYQVAMLLDANSLDKPSGTVLELREHGTIPLLMCADMGHHMQRLSLRVGLAAIVSPDFRADVLDRNIRVIAENTETRADMVKSEKVARGAFRPESGVEGMRVLVVEDSLINQRVIRNQLKTLGIEPTLAADGEKGLAALKEGVFELVLCDCSMPVMDGYQFTRAVREQEAKIGKQPPMPIIALTANAFREDVEKCFASGMNDFVSKPATIERLAAKLRKWRASNSEQSANKDSAAQTPVAVDVSLLANQLSNNDPAYIKQSLDILWETVAGTPSELRQLAAERNEHELLRVAHAARGALALGGARILEEQLKALETSLRATGWKHVSALLPAIEESFEDLEQFIALYSGEASSK